jgi:hypothetical protein
MFLEGIGGEAVCPDELLYSESATELLKLCYILK